jgi:hypothetical protein
MDDGHIVVDWIAPIAIDDITHDLARESDSTALTISWRSRGTAKATRPT